MPDPTAEAPTTVADALTARRTLLPLPTPDAFVRMADDLAADLRAAQDAAGIPEHRLGPVVVGIDPAADDKGFEHNVVTFSVSRDMLLDMGLAEPTPAEAAERAAQLEAHRANVRDAWEVFDAATSALAQVEDPALAAVITLHRPQPPEYGPPARVVCRGCDAEGFDREPPDWPCRTVETVATVLGVVTPEPYRLSLSYDAESGTWQRP